MVSARLPHTLPAYVRSTAIVLALILALGGGVPAVAYSASLTVTTTADELNHDGDCSLREAIRAANLDSAVDACRAGHGADTITLPAGTYTLTLAGADEDAAATGDLDISADLKIKGAGGTKTIVDGNNSDRVFQVIAGKVTISGVSIRAGNVLYAGNGGGLLNTGGDVKLVESTVSGSAAGRGSGIYNARTLVVDHSSVDHNRDAFWDGGGIYNTGTLTIQHSSIRGNAAAESGGDIRNKGGTLKITGSTISDNLVVYGTGGGIDGGFVGDGGSITIMNSTISGNSVDDDRGGGIWCGPNVTIANSTISANQSIGTYSGGGGIACRGNLTITNSTISANLTWGDGGAIDSSGSVWLNNVTIAYNQAGVDTQHRWSGDGGAIHNAGGTLTVANSIIALNQDADNGAAPDCSGALTSQGYNLISSTAGCAIGGSTKGNQTRKDPKLGRLADNGGPTFTHAFRSGSPAINKGNPAAPGSSDTACMARDQRGVTRPQGARCDIGAYELSR